MKENKNEFKLYNVIFPFWMLILFPYFWLVIFPVNFIIDSLVLLVAMFALKIQDKKAYYKKHIVKTAKEIRKSDNKETALRKKGGISLFVPLLAIGAVVYLPELIFVFLK